MNGPASPSTRVMVTETLRALGGQGTLGDLVGITGLSRAEVEESLQALMAAERGHVRVSESGVVVYHFGKTAQGSRSPSEVDATPPGIGARLSRRLGWRPQVHNRRLLFDRKTLRLIRAREGVISLAELVEHTGLPLAEAKEEMRRLVEDYGGESHPSWDGHVVCAFPGLMTSAREGVSTREPRPAWVRAKDPMRISNWSSRHETATVAVHAVGLASSIAMPWVASIQYGNQWPTAALASVAVLSAGGVLAFGTRLLRSLGDHRLFRFRHPKTLRRYALGHVFETALKGKGVVSLERTVQYLEARAGKRSVSRPAVEKALRQLAEEFEAVITEHNGDLFFGFRNVKRQFLASHVQRRELQLARTARGRTVYDSADSPLEAAGRELEAFDRELEALDPELDFDGELIEGGADRSDPSRTQLG